MKAFAVFALTAALSLTPSLTAKGQIHKDLQPSLLFLKTLSTPMPNPEAPSWYSQVPDSDGSMRSIGHAGWVKGFFSQMRPVVPKFLAMDERLRKDVNAYTDTVHDLGGKVLASTTGLQKALKDVDGATAQRLQELLDKYNDEVTATRKARKAYEATLLRAERAKWLLDEKDKTSEQCNKRVERAKAEADKAAALDRIGKGRTFLDAVEKAIRAIADGPQATAAYVTGELTTRSIEAAKTIILDAFYSGTRETLYELDARIDAIDKSLSELECKPQASALKAAKLALQEAMIHVVMGHADIVEHRASAWRVVDRLGTLQGRGGKTVPFLTALQAYNAQVNKHGRRIYDSVNAYLEFLSKEPLWRGDLVLLAIEEDIERVESEKQKRDPSGKWLAVANDALGYVNDYTKWYRGELRRGQNALADLREGRHLEFVDRMVARAIRELGGTVTYEDIIK